MHLTFTLPKNLTKYIAKLRVITRHHYFISVVFLISGLAAAVYVVNDTLSMPTDTAYQEEKLKATIGTQFNKSANDTIEKIKALQRSSEPSSQTNTLPSGRINPFAE